MTFPSSFSISRKTGMVILVAGVLNCVFSLPATGQDRQYKIEAAYLYSFFNYITWPDHISPQDLKEPVICVYGNDPILHYLEYVRNKMSSERLLTVLALGDDQNTSACHLLFIRHRISFKLLQSLSSTTITILKAEDPLDRGGMIELTEDDERIIIRINQAELENKGFKISSRLLELTQRIR